jgi:hypothetical protein
MKDFAAMLPRIADPIDRNNVLRALEGFLAMGRKLAGPDAADRRAAAMVLQAPVWEALIDQLPALRQDRTTQYAILHRLLREIGPARDGAAPSAALSAPLQGVRQRLAALLQGPGEDGPVVRENSHAIAALLLQRLAPAGGGAAATSAASIDATPASDALGKAIASLPALMPEQAALYHKDLADRINALEQAENDRDVRCALLYSIGKHLPGLDPKYFDMAWQVPRHLRDFPLPDGHLLFGLVGRDGAHSNAVVARHSADKRAGEEAAWFIDSASTYGVAVRDEFLAKRQKQPAPLSSLITNLDMQQDRSSCGSMSLSAMSQMFRHYELTDDIMQVLAIGRRIGDAYVEDASEPVQYLGCVFQPIVDGISG